MRPSQLFRQCRNNVVIRKTFIKDDEKADKVKASVGVGVATVVAKDCSRGASANDVLADAYVEALIGGGIAVTAIAITASLPFLLDLLWGL